MSALAGIGDFASGPSASRTRLLRIIFGGGGGAPEAAEGEPPGGGGVPRVPFLLTLLGDPLATWLTLKFGPRTPYSVLRLGLPRPMEQRASHSRSRILTALARHSSLQVPAEDDGSNAQRGYI